MAERIAGLIFGPATRIPFVSELTIFCLIAVMLAYTLRVFAFSRSQRNRLPRAPSELFFVFVMPCLNEEAVIGASLDRLLALGKSRFAVLVIDDGSDDETSQIVRRYDPDRVWLLQRKAPHAREGKGVALNAAYQYLKWSGVLSGHRAEDVVVAVLDADGRIAPNALHEVGPHFADPRVAAVQVGIRMYNAERNLLARMQDMEFIIFTEVFQRGRQRIGSVGLGGNGQFARLAALDTLGAAPWSSCLTEDLELGLQLRLGGWTNSFCPTSWVAQEAVVDVRRLVRQRSRWFQGNLQCLKLLGPIFRSRIPLGAAFDLSMVLIGSLLILLTSLMALSFLTSALALTLRAATRYPAALLSPSMGASLAAVYILAFGPAAMYAFVYWVSEPRVTLPRAVVLGHVYTLYAYLWFLAGIMAIWRIVHRRDGWLKTARARAEQPA